MTYIDIERLHYDWDYVGGLVAVFTGPTAKRLQDHYTAALHERSADDDPVPVNLIQVVLDALSPTGPEQNIAPIFGGALAHDDAYVILQGHSLTADSTKGVLANDDASAGAAAVLSGVAHGQLRLNADGGLSYTPNAGFNGVDTFSYDAFGANGASDIGHASIYVAPVNVGTTTTLNLLALNSLEQIATLYVAFLDRAPDAPGFEFWVNQFNQNLPTQGAEVVLTNIANAIAASPEATAKGPLLANGATDEEIQKFIQDKYVDLYNRVIKDKPDDDPGVDFWRDKIKDLTIPKLDEHPVVGPVVLAMVSGSQDTAVGKDITTLMSKVAVSLDYVQQQEIHGTVWAGASDTAAATALLQGVTSDPSTLLVGLQNAEALIAAHA